MLVLSLVSRFVDVILIIYISMLALSGVSRRAIFLKCVF